MGTKERLQARVNDELVLHAGNHADPSGYLPCLTRATRRDLEGSRPLAADAGLEPSTFTLAR